MKLQSINYRAVTTCLATVLLAGIVPSIANAAAGTTRYHSKGLTAALTFDGTSGSVETYLSLSATQGQGKDPSVLYVDVDQFDYTNGDESFYSGYLPLTSSQFQISSSLQSASLNVTGMVLQDYYGNSVLADIPITWTGSGGQPSAISKSNQDFRIVIPGSGIFGFRVHSTGMMRASTASGSFLLSGTNVLAGVPNYSDAELLKSSYVEFDITK